MLGGRWLGATLNKTLARSSFFLLLSSSLLNHPPPSSSPRLLGHVVYIVVCSSWFQQTRFSPFNFLLTSQLDLLVPESSTLNTQPPDFPDPLHLEHNYSRPFDCEQPALGREHPRCSTMTCSASSVTMESYAEGVASSTATPSEDTALLRDRRRRHSYHAPRKLSCDYQDADTVFIRVSLAPEDFSGHQFRSNRTLGRTLPRRT
jgi:hypothetical protein